MGAFSTSSAVVANAWPNAFSSGRHELDHQRSRMDRRSVRVSLTDRGSEVADIVNGLYDRHIRSIDQIGGIASDDFRTLNRSLQRLERFWTDQILYRL